MKKFFIMMMTAFLAACGQTGSNGDTGVEEFSLEPIAVDLQVPETLALNQEANLQAIVTQGEETVDDADEVIFEIWSKGNKDASEMIESEHRGNGVYAITKSFEQEAIYTVQSHVTARSMHTMPTATITVGNPEASAEHNHEDAEHHHDSDITYHFEIGEEIEVHKQQDILVELKEHGEPLTGANVTLQIAHTTEEDGSWIDLNETANGTYTGITTFAFEGEYQIVIHIKKDDLHDHKETTITVK